MVRITGSTLKGTQVAMFAEGTTDKPLQTFESIGKAGRAFGYNKSFTSTVYKQTVIEVTWKGKKMKVYFKEV
jgi:hypothetical protein